MANESKSTTGGPYALMTPDEYFAQNGIMSYSERAQWYFEQAENEIYRKHEIRKATGKFFRQDFLEGGEPSTESFREYWASVPEELKTSSIVASVENLLAMGRLAALLAMEDRAQARDREVKRAMHKESQARESVLRALDAVFNAGDWEPEEEHVSVSEVIQQMMFYGYQSHDWHADFLVWHTLSQLVSVTPMGFLKYDELAAVFSFSPDAADKEQSD